MITREETTILKGFSILIIILTHFSDWIMSIGDFGSICQVAVFIFLFMSGYGTVYSYNNKGLGGFFVGRLKKVYIPFLIVAIPLFIIEVWRYRNNIGDMYIASTVLSAVGIYPCNLLDGTYWFITFIIIQYLFFWIAFKFGKSAVRKKVILIILTLCGYIIFKKYFIWVNDNDVYAFAFLLGVVYSDFIQKAKMPSKKVYIYILMVLCVMVYLITLQWFDNSIDRVINGISLAIVEIMVAKILKTYMSIKLPILSFAGRISYELYLTEGIFFNNKILYDVVGYNYAGLILHICVIVVLSIAIQKLSYVITRCIGGGGHA